MSENLSQELAQWYTSEASANRGLNAPGLHETALTEQQRRTRDTLVDKFLQERRQHIYDEVKGDLAPPDLVTVNAPEIAGPGAIDAMYHPQGLRSIGSAPRGGSTIDAEQIIQTGQGEIADAKAVSNASRIGHVQGAATLQGEVDTSLNKGFFVDPNLRK